MRISDWSSDVCSSDLDGAKSRVAARTGLGRVRDFLYGIEHEYVGARLDEPDALHCFLGRKLAPGYIGWAAQGPTGVQAGLAFRHRPSRTGTPDIDGLHRRSTDERRVGTEGVTTGKHRGAADHKKKQK